ncbi:hypothetical protein, partial [Thiolapillus sp.]|uniref:hypothetical protein n=1 Tax=Thiolapillus sp. TaxID=2017437 RepID=UPI003AF41290
MHGGNRLGQPHSAAPSGGIAHIGNKAGKGSQRGVNHFRRIVRQRMLPMSPLGNHVVFDGFPAFFEIGYLL